MATNLLDVLCKTEYNFTLNENIEKNNENINNNNNTSNNIDKTNHNHDIRETANTCSADTITSSSTNTNIECTIIEDDDDENNNNYNSNLVINKRNIEEIDT